MIYKSLGVINENILKILAVVSTNFCYFNKNPTCRTSAVLKTLSILSWCRYATPLYMNCRRIWRSWCRVPSKITISCPFSAELLKSLEKCELHAAKTSRWALNDSPKNISLKFVKWVTNDHFFLTECLKD